jgi:energy-coupling factor transporter ATP-binding protein EcfA2
MKNAKNNHLRFIGLKLRNYKVFGGANEFRFDRHRTLIAGNGGTGKTVIAEVLRHLGPPARDGKEVTLNSRFASSIAVITEGNCDLINKYRNLIFVSGECVDKMPLRSPRKAIIGKARTMFEKIVKHKPWKIDMHRDLSPGTMAGGERVCLGYAFVFAVRKTLKLDVPVVFDSPYARLDSGLRKGLHDFLKTQPYQQIVLGHECELSEEDDPAYMLVHKDNCSQVVEL